MTVIEATAVRVNTLADGSMRLTVDIEPRHAIDAFKLFSAPGTPMALAALKMVPLSTEPEKPKGGALSQWVAMRCKEPEFQEWLNEADENSAKLRVLGVCDIESRAELDNDKVAAERFEALIRIPWARFNKEKA